MAVNDEPIFPPDMPEEIKTEILQRHRSAKMEFDAIRHDIVRAFTEMSGEHLLALDKVFTGLINAGNQGAAYYSGLIDGILLEKFSICPNCGVDHSTELLPQPSPPEDDNGTAATPTHE